VRRCRQRRLWTASEQPLATSRSGTAISSLPLTLRPWGGVPASQVLPADKTRRRSGGWQAAFRSVCAMLGSRRARFSSAQQWLVDVPQVILSSHALSLRRFRQCCKSTCGLNRYRGGGLSSNSCANSNDSQVHQNRYECILPTRLPHPSPRHRCLDSWGMGRARFSWAHCAVRSGEWGTVSRRVAVATFESTINLDLSLPLIPVIVLRILI
jgi:hypothetical protein